MCRGGGGGFIEEVFIVLRQVALPPDSTIFPNFAFLEH